MFCGITDIFLMHDLWRSYFKMIVLPDLKFKIIKKYWDDIIIFDIKYTTRLIYKSLKINYFDGFERSKYRSGYLSLHHRTCFHCRDYYIWVIYCVPPCSPFKKLSPGLRDVLFAPLL